MRAGQQLPESFVAEWSRQSLEPSPHCSSLPGLILLLPLHSTGLGFFRLLSSFGTGFWETVDADLAFVTPRSYQPVQETKAEMIQWQYNSHTCESQQQN